MKARVVHSQAFPRAQLDLPSHASHIADWPEKEGRP